MEEEKKPKYLPLCARCGRIRIQEHWLKREENPQQYDTFRNKYGKDVSHGECPECNAEQRRKLDLDNN